LLDWLRPADRRVLVLLSKCDKLSRRERDALVASLPTLQAKLGSSARILLFSSKSGEGVEASRALLESWLRAARDE